MPIAPAYSALSMTSFSAALAGISGQNGEYMLVSPSPSAAPSPMGVTKPSPNPGAPSPAPTAAAQGAVAPDRAADGGGGGSGMGLGFVTPITSPRGEPSAPRPMLSGSPAALARAAEVWMTLWLICERSTFLDVGKHLMECKSSTEVELCYAQAVCSCSLTGESLGA